ncbi:MAG: substrate-binding domain-containing protein [Armatimonadota bacterium]
MKCRWMLLAALIGIILLGAGCGKEQGASSASRTSPAAKKDNTVSTITTGDLDKVGKATKPFKLALIVKTRNNPFFSPMIAAAEAEAKKLGVKLEVQSPAQEGDKERQFAIVQDVTAKGVDAIMIAPADSKGIVPALKQARKKGILVINLDNRIDRATAKFLGLDLSGYVGVDNEAGGKLAGEAMVAVLGGKGKVGLMEGIRSADNAAARKRGFESGVAGKLDIIVRDTAEWDTQKAYDKFQSMYTAHPEMQAIFCANDKMALGVAQALREAGKARKIYVIGYDGIPDCNPYIKKGEMYATIAQPPDKMGEYGVKMAVGILDDVVEKGKELLLELKVRTKETL